MALRRGGGGFVVAYDRSGGVEVAEVNAFNTVTALHNAGSAQFGPAVSINALDGYLLTYTSHDATGQVFDIRGRRGLLGA